MPLWGVLIIEAARSGRRTAPWLQRVRIYDMAFNDRPCMNVVATPLWGICIFEAARSGRRTAPWL